MAVVNCGKLNRNLTDSPDIDGRSAIWGETVGKVYSGNVNGARLQKNDSSPPIVVPGPTLPAGTPAHEDSGVVEITICLDEM
jgi:hypothetical protein